MLAKIGVTVIMAAVALGLTGTTLLAMGIKSGAPVALLFVALWVLLGGLALVTAAVWRDK